jgi:sialate O-acetylesterase
MVLQTGKPTRLWGWDRPGQRVSAGFEGGAAPSERPSATAGSDGKFQLELPLLPAGGPYTLRVSGSSELRVEDVLAGEVWLASGQSNMEWPVAASADAEREISSADRSSIRMIKIAPTAESAPALRVDGAWRVASPEHVARFSAVGYAFAKALEARLSVPVGIIDATWGGTPIHAWTSLEVLRESMPDVDERLKRLAAELEHLPARKAEYEAILSDWERRSFPADPPNTAFQRGYAEREFDDSGWQEMALPRFWQELGMAHNGVVWFRKQVELPAALRGHDLDLHLGAIDDFDHSYVNGELVGAHPDGTPGAFQIPRVYRVPARVTQAGKLCIAVRVFDHFGQGGFAGPSSEMFVQSAGAPGERLSLAGPWRFFVEHAIPLVSGEVYRSYPTPPDVLAQHMNPARLHNGMLAPLFPLNLRGFIWYQGETDVERHALYRARQVALIRDLRAHFEQGQLPFYFVQLASFRATPHWPYLREAQAEALSEPETGMVTALDIGDSNDIHPRNKREVGQRLAALALRRVYGFGDVIDSGPTLLRVTREGHGLSVHFQNAAGLRTRDGTAVRGFEVAGCNRVYHPAQAVLEGERVRLSSPLVPNPSAARYAWADDPSANLENGAGLPAFPFRTDPWPLAE